MQDKLRIVYLKLYVAGQKVLDRHDPCHIHRASDGKLKCVGGTPCCYGCQHLTPQGCSVQALQCKLFLCGYAREASPEAARALDKLNMVRQASGVPFGFRTSMEETLRGR